MSINSWNDFDWSQVVIQIQVTPSKILSFKLAVV